MTPDIRLEFRLKVKAGSADHRRRVPAEEPRGERRPGAPAGGRALTTSTSACSTATPACRISPRVDHHRTLQRDRSRRHAQPPADLRVPPERAGERDAVRPPDLHDLVRRRSAARRRTPTPVADALLPGGAEQDGTLRRRHRDGAAPHPRRSGIRLPLRAAAGRRRAAARRIASATRARLAPVVLPLVQRFPTMNCWRWRPRASCTSPPCSSGRRAGCSPTRGRARWSPTSRASGCTCGI